MSDNTTIYIVVAIVILLVIGVVVAAICTAQKSSSCSNNTGCLSPSCSSVSCSSDSSHCENPFFFTGATGTTGPTGPAAGLTLAFAEFCFTGAGSTGTVSAGDAFVFNGIPAMYPANSFLQPLSQDEVTVPNVGWYEVYFELYTSNGSVAASIAIGGTPLTYATFGRRADDTQIIGRALVEITDVNVQTISILAALGNTSDMNVPATSSEINTTVSILIIKQLR